MGYFYLPKGKALTCLNGLTSTPTDYTTGDSFQGKEQDTVNLCKCK